jgi:hypothetical protein
VCAAVLCALSPRARAQESEPSKPPAATEAAAEPPAELPALDADDSDAAEAKPNPALKQPGLDQAELRLQQARDDRAQASRLLPWLTLSVGATSMIVAATAGAIKALACDTTCDTPNWVAFTVVAGAAVTTLGTVWVVHRDADIRELDSHVYHLEQELERVRLSRTFHEPEPQRSLAYLSWQFRL